MVIELKKITVAEFRQMEFDESDNDYYELIDGEIMKKSAPKPLHQQISVNLVLQIGIFIKEKKLGKLLTAPIDVFLDGYSAVQPDLVFIKNENLGIITDDGIIGKPDLLIEIISPSSVIRDRVEKMKLYEKLGISEYWIIDPQYKDIEIYSIVDERYALLSGVTTFEGELKSNILSGIQINLNELFE